MPNKLDITKFYFKESGSAPFPIQRLQWINKLFPLTDSVFKHLKSYISCTDTESNDYLSGLTTMSTTHNVVNSLVKDTIPVTNNEFIHSAVYNLTFMYNWNIYKQIYKFDNDTLDMLINGTNIDKLPVEILNYNLPYPAFFIDNKFKSIHSKISFRGCFVSLLKIENRLELGLFFIEDSSYSDYHYCFIPLYFGNLSIKECMEQRDILFNVNSNNEESILMLDLANQVIKLIIYICSVNREIETIKINVNSTKINKNKKYKSKPKSMTINQNLVGYRIGNTIRQNKKSYVYVDDLENIVDKYNGDKTLNRKSPKPHMRMAHYHHYWTGKKDNPKERKLIVKYIAPTYIGNNHDVLPTVHKVKT